MEILILLILFVTAIGGASIFVDRRIQARKLTDSQADTVMATNHLTDSTTVNTSFTARISDTMRAMQERLFTNRSQEAQAEEFRAWLVDAFNTSETGDVTIQQWLSFLSQEGMVAFTQQMQLFCSEMNIELSWLLHDKLKINPVLQNAATEMIRYYCRSCYQAVLMQPDVHAFQALNAFEQNPMDKLNRAFGQRLFVNLLEANLVEVNMSEHLLASEEKKVEQIIVAIHQAAAVDNWQFNQILKATTTEMARPQIDEQESSSGNESSNISTMTESSIPADIPAEAVITPQATPDPNPNIDAQKATTGA